MEATILDSIPFQIDDDQFLKSLNLKAEARYVGEIADLLKQAHQIGRPKGLYTIAFVESRDDDSVVIEGIRFNSRVLRVNLGEVQRVFPFAATCGLELEEWSKTIEGMPERYWADRIKETVLEWAIKALSEHVVQTYQLGPMAAMNPGALADWPTSEQKKLFTLFGSAADAIGVQLTESSIMYPIKSVSGIWFPSAAAFENCQLCPILQCPKRRKPYDKELYDRKYRKCQASTLSRPC